MANEPIPAATLPVPLSSGPINRWAGDMARTTKLIFDKVIFRLNQAVYTSGSQTIGGAKAFSLPPVLPTYAVASLPSAATYVRGLIYVSDETGGPTVAFSDGTNWRRVQDLAIVS